MKVKCNNLILFILILNIAVNGQMFTDESFSIEWKSNFSREVDIKSEDGFFTQVFNLFTGASEKKLLKPFNLITISEDSLIILDQGLFTPILVSPHGFEIIQNNKFNFFPSLVGISKFTHNKILFTDSKLSKIFSYNFRENILDTLNISFLIDQPTGIIYDHSNEILYVSETSKHRILVLDKEGKLLRTIGQRGEKEGEFNFPTFLEIDDAGNLYVIDALNFRLQIFNKNGKFVSQFGKAGDASGYFNRPKGIAIDSYGHIFIADALFHSVQVFDIDGNFLYNFGGLGQLNSRFWLPSGITIDAENKIYIADSYNSRIQVFRLIVDEKN